MSEPKLTYEEFWKKVRETGWNPSPDELRSVLAGMSEHRTSNHLRDFVTTMRDAYVRDRQRYDPGTYSEALARIDIETCSQLLAALDERDALAARGAALETDAARYRWLRQFTGSRADELDLNNPESPEHCDALIDAARAAGEDGR